MTKYNTEHQAKLARNRQMERWRKENTTIVNFRFNKDKDKKVLDKLKAVPNKIDYVRQLILKDIDGGE